MATGSMDINRYEEKLTQLRRSYLQALEQSAGVVMHPDPPHPRAELVSICGSGLLGLPPCLRPKIDREVQEGTEMVSLPLELRLGKVYLLVIMLAFRIQLKNKFQITRRKKYLSSRFWPGHHRQQKGWIKKMLMFDPVPIKQEAMDPVSVDRGPPQNQFTMLQTVQDYSEALVMMESVWPGHHRQQKRWIKKMLMFDPVPIKQEAMDPVSVSYPSNYMDQMKPNKYSVIYSAPSMLHNKFYSNPDGLSNGIQLEPVDLTVNKRSSPPSAGSSPSPLKFQTVHRRTSPALTLSSPSSPISKFTPSPPGVQPLSMPITIPPVMAAALSRHGLRSPGILPVIQPVVVQPVPFMYAPHLQQPIMVSTVLTDEMESPSSMQVPVIESFEKPALKKTIKVEPGSELSKADFYPERMSPPMTSLSPQEVMLQEALSTCLWLCYEKQSFSVSDKQALEELGSNTLQIVMLIINQLESPFGYRSAWEETFASGVTRHAKKTQNTSVRL
ncbi:UNVERIFIED_CONTAM: hypothetical protein H355_002986 [Colinus virginianus]|nr:hypothetical protein H355_002986 [Colinus virginianus]